MEILSTKLYRPRPPERLIKRPYLLQQLEEGLERKITLITAPAGYGKTVLLSSWLAEEKHLSCWASLDEDDNTPRNFLTVLISAIQTLFPKACSSSLALIHAVEPPPFSVLQTHLINELDHLSQKIILVLDDYHVIFCPEIHAFMMNWVTRMPASMHLVISSRANPPFPIALWRARQHIHEMDTQALRFTDQEAETFLKGTVGNSLTGEMQKIIQNKTEGWAAGLQLAALSARSATDALAFIQSFEKHGSAGIREFLLDQAFLSQPSAIQEFLLKTSILHRFTAPVCNALGLSGENLRNTQDTIDILCRTNLFIVPLDEQTEWFRYHNLFAEMLQRRLKVQYGTEEIRDLHRRAMQWFEAHDLIDDAIEHALAAGDEDAAVQIIEKHIFNALNQERNAVIDRWLHAINTKTIETRPRLMMVRAWIESYNDCGLSATNIPHLLKAKELLEQRREELDTETHVLLDGYISALEPLYFLLSGDFELGSIKGEHALRILPANHSYVRGRALMGWALCTQAMGKSNEVVRHLLEERETHSEVNTYTLMIHLMLACIYSMSGKPDELKHAAQSLHAKAQKNGYQILTGWGHYMLGLAAYIGNDLKKAQHHFKCAADMRYLISKSIVRDSLVGLALVSQTLGDFDETRTAVDLLKELEGGGIHDYLLSLQARLALSRNDLAAAQQWSMTEPITLPQYMLVRLEVPHFTQVRIWITEGKPENLTKSVALLNDLAKMSETMGSHWRVLECSIWLACAFYKQGRRKAALEKMEQAIQLAQPGIYIFLFIDACPLAAEILSQVESRNTRFVQQILSCYSTSPNKENHHPLLTRRELEVLHLLDSHLSEREIADQLSVSLDTVKKHCYHIYNKLGVNRRRDAIKTAREIKVLP